MIASTGDSDRSPVPITGDSIRLGQLLKLVDVVDQGSDAKLLLAENRVQVNGEVETRRGRQLAKGDVVDIDGMVVEVA